MNKLVFPEAFAPSVNQIGNLRERKERDSDGQDHPANVPVRTQRVIEVFYEEVGVLEIAQQHQVGDNAKHQPSF